jgi:hypothetical protein
LKSATIAAAVGLWRCGVFSGEKAGKRVIEGRDIVSLRGAIIRQTDCSGRDSERGQQARQRRLRERLATSPFCPGAVVQAGEILGQLLAGWRYVEFFTANIRNPNTLTTIRPHDVATYIEKRQATHSAPDVKQQLAAVRMMFDWLIVGQVAPSNPASAVRGPKHVIKTGKTPVLEGKEWRRLIDAIPTDTVRDLRDRALIATLTYGFARIGAALKMRVEDATICPGVSAAREIVERAQSRMEMLDKLGKMGTRPAAEIARDKRHVGTAARTVAKDVREGSINHRNIRSAIVARSSHRPPRERRARCLQRSPRKSQTASTRC